MAQNLLIDTSVILEGGEEIIAKLEKIAPVFVTDIVLQELDGHKNNANSSVAYRAREFFRKLGNSNGEALDAFPDGIKLEKTDSLRKMFLGAIPLHVIVRKPYKSKDINDSKIIEVAKDYNMTLVTLDTAQRVRGLSDGVNAVTLEAILPQENIIERKDTMREIKKIEDTQDEKKGFSIIVVMVGVIFIIASLYFSSNIFGYVLFFVGLAMVSSMFNKKSNRAKEQSMTTMRQAQSNDNYSSGESAIAQLQRNIEKENREQEKIKKPFFSFGRDDDYTRKNFDKLTDPRFSSLPGNIFYKD